MMKKLFVTSIALMTLVGCATKAPQVESESVQYVKFDPQNWQADGKIGFKYPHCSQYRPCKTEAINASYVWTRSPTSDYLQLFDPTGQEQLALTYTDDHVIVKENGTEQTISVEELTERFGVPLPLEQLGLWLTEKREEERWESDGWSIRVDDWQGHYYRKMTLTQDEYRVRLVTYNVIPTLKSE